MFIPVRTVLAASSTANPLSGTQYETLPYNAQVEAAIQADATGVLATFYTGTDVIQEEGPVQLGTINVQPKYPDDFFIRDVVAAGEKIGLKLRDTSGAQRIVMTTLVVTHLG